MMKKLLIFLGLRSKCCGAKKYENDYGVFCSKCEKAIYRFIS